VVSRKVWRGFAKLRETKTRNYAKSIFMLFLKKLSIYLFGLVNLYLLYLLFNRPEKIWYVVIILAVLLFLVTKFVIGKQFRAKDALPSAVPGILKRSLSGWKDFFVFYSLGLLLVLSSILFLLILENTYLRYILIILVSGAITFYLQLIFGYLYSSHKYQPFSLNRFFEYSSLLIIFFTSVGLLALNIFLYFSFWLTGLILAVLAVILILQNLEINKLDLKKYYYFPFILFIIIFELSALLTWLPINYYLKGFLIAILYFLFLNLMNRSLKNNWNKKAIFWMIIIVTVVVVILMFTTRWL